MDAKCNLFLYLKVDDLSNAAAQAVWSAALVWFHREGCLQWVVAPVEDRLHRSFVPQKARHSG
jgi:hypothetical protein